MGDKHLYNVKGNYPNPNLSHVDCPAGTSAGTVCLAAGTVTVSVTVGNLTMEPKLLTIVQMKSVSNPTWSLHVEHLLSIVHPLVL